MDETGAGWDVAESEDVAAKLLESGSERAIVTRARSYLERCTSTTQALVALVHAIAEEHAEFGEVGAGWDEVVKAVAALDYRAIAELEAKAL